MLSMVKIMASQVNLFGTKIEIGFIEDSIMGKMGMVGRMGKVIYEGLFSISAIHRIFVIT